MSFFYVKNSGKIIADFYIYVGGDEMTKILIYKEEKTDEKDKKDDKDCK